MHSLPLFHRIARQAVVVLGEGAVAEARRRLVERAGGEAVGEDAAARLGFVAFGDGRDDEAAARLRERGVLLNVADRPDLCDFTLPSVLERGPLLVAVSSGGASAGLTKALRLRLETLIPEATGRKAARSICWKNTTSARSMPGWRKRAPARRRFTPSRSPATTPTT
jgi:uroporphyrin-III C-methyltransferase / precorrin-2 dehydrogenase / sirohydrochlorin ferrochelatase